MPPGLPLWGDKRDYDMDAPITVFGTTQARLVGRSSVWICTMSYIWCGWSKRFTAPCGVFVFYSWIMFYFLPGEALLESNTVIDFVYCSPSLRCVQTAQNILKGKNRIGNSLTFLLRLICGMLEALYDLWCGLMSRFCVNRSAAGREVEGEGGARPLWMDQVGFWEFFARVDSSHRAGSCQLQYRHNVQVRHNFLRSV